MQNTKLTWHVNEEFLSSYFFVGGNSDTLSLLGFLQFFTSLLCWCPLSNRSRMGKRSYLRHAFSMFLSPCRALYYYVVKPHKWLGSGDEGGRWSTD